MKNFLISGLLSLVLFSCGQTTGSKEATHEQTTELAINDAKVKVYYFHGKQRCVTCMTAQQVAQDAVMENFSDNPDVAFVEVDVDDPANAELAEKYEVVFSTLIIAGNNSHKDITDKSFALAMNNPTDLKALIVAETNALLTN
ncbi:MAG: nitrophenyl compound nitroreductase subunit ArsF family protein [Bacteroidota bacterium]